MRLKVFTDDALDLDEQARSAVSDWAYGNLVHDLDGGFTVDGDTPHYAAALHLTETVPEGGESRGLNMQLPGRNPDDLVYLLVRDENGELFDHSRCRELIPSRHVTGMIFADPHGDLWIAREPDEGSGDGQVRADWPIHQISKHTHPTVAAGFGEIAEEVPAMGEFIITEEEPARVAWIPWWSGAGSDPENGVAAPEEDAILDHFQTRVAELKTRIADLRAHYRVSPDPASSPSSLDSDTRINLSDWRPPEDHALGDPASISLKIRAEEEQLIVEDEAGRVVRLELEAGVLRVHGYNETSEAPATLEITTEKPILAHNGDHLANQNEKDPSP